ncbi:hypothetical protein CFP56_025864 [Quercus suber]|uniref:Uncharacterized protein n=1 Tax=Quercus suber TaxID=58331 RepID=A0AAW0K2G9_QUESU
MNFHLNPSPNGFQAENEERKPESEDKSSRHSPLLPSRRTSTTATQIAGAERVLTVPSFACPNLHHTTHRSSPPQRSLELWVELGNIPEPP